MSQSQQTSSAVSDFGTHPSNNKPVHKIDIESPSGNLRASFITFGATLQSLKMKNNTNKEVEEDNSNNSFTELILGFSNIERYANGAGHLGATVGRFANRIGGGKFPRSLLNDNNNDNENTSPYYELPKNNNNLNCLHGGPNGYSRIVWDEFEVVYSPSSSIAADNNDKDEDKNKKAIGVRFKHVSPDADEGFPGEIHIQAFYYFDILPATGEEGLFMDFRGFVPLEKTISGDGDDETKNKKSKNSATICSLCNHAYYNLAGYANEKNIMESHHLHIPNGKFYLPLDKFSIPTGEILKTEGTVLDFCSNGGKRLCDGGVEDSPIINPGAPAKGGYDNCIILGRPIGSLEHAVTLKTAKRQMKVYTTLPGVQVYSGNYLPDDYSLIGHEESLRFGYRGGLCLETQLFPDGPNHPAHFPSCVVKPGETWKHLTVHTFSAL